MIPAEFEDENKRFREMKLGEDAPPKKLSDYQPETIEQYEEKANPILNKNNREIVNLDKYEVVNKKWYSFIKWFGIGLILILAIFAFLAYKGYFQSELTCPENNITIPACPNVPACPSIPACPACKVNLTCPDFPKSININMSGGLNASG
jgi:hypothetical protein